MNLAVYLTEYFGQNFLYEIKTGLFKQIVRLPMKFFDNNPVGKIMARIESDGEAIRQFFGPIRNLSSQFQIIQKASASLKRINEILNEPVEKGLSIGINKKDLYNKKNYYKIINKNNKNQLVDENKIKKRKSIKSNCLEFKDFKKNIVFKNVLHNVNFEINKGEKVLIYAF